MAVVTPRQPQSGRYAVHAWLAMTCPGAVLA